MPSVDGEMLLGAIQFVTFPLTLGEQHEAKLLYVIQRFISPGYFSYIFTPGELID